MMPRPNRVDWVRLPPVKVPTKEAMSPSVPPSWFSNRFFIASWFTPGSGIQKPMR